MSPRTFKNLDFFAITSSKFNKTTSFWTNFENNFVAFTLLRVQISSLRELKLR